MHGLYTLTTEPIFVYSVQYTVLRYKDCDKDFMIKLANKIFDPKIRYRYCKTQNFMLNLNSLSATFSTDSKSASNPAFFVPPILHFEEKISLGDHISTFYKLGRKKLKNG
jgi:hypothetical protein